MRSRFVRLVAVTVAFAVLNTGCMMSRLVDRAFLGITSRRPTYNDRKTTGVFLLPITFVIDVATFPIQALLVVLLGDQFPFNDTNDSLSKTYALNDNPRFQQLGAEQQKLALAELEQLIRSGAVTPETALALLDDGHWQIVRLDAEARQQLLARAQSPEAQSFVCAR
ncbi:MAG: hypothetical protein JNG84_15165 [Archangium sp.]|nr:hypothetical protein [Archangium sp.]